MSSTFDEVREHLTEAIEAGTAMVPADLSMKFRRRQGPASIEGSPEGREFAVSGPKADKVRALIFADLGLTRKQISQLVGCSVSRVSEVVWGLEHDHVEFPTIPLREAKPEPALKPGLTPQVSDEETNAELVAMIEASIAQRKAEQEVAAAAEAAETNEDDQSE